MCPLIVWHCICDATCVTGITIALDVIYSDVIAVIHSYIAIFEIDSISL